MVAAATRAGQTYDPSDDENRRFRTFIFLFANAFLHEIGHTLVTFLTKGRTGTPPHIKAQVRGYSGEFHGEAGRNLETIIFGGTLEYYLDHADDYSQVRLPSCSLLILIPFYSTSPNLYADIYSARRPSYPHQLRRPPDLAGIHR